MSLLQFEDEVMPLTFADVLIIRYLIGAADENHTITDFNLINNASKMNWSLRSHITKFIRRFITDPYCEKDAVWIQKTAENFNINLKRKFEMLNNALKANECS